MSNLVFSMLSIFMAIGLVWYVENAVRPVRRKRGKNLMMKSFRVFLRPRAYIPIAAVGVMQVTQTKIPNPTMWALLILGILGCDLYFGIMLDRYRGKIMSSRGAISATFTSLIPILIPLPTMFWVLRHRSLLVRTDVVEGIMLVALFLAGFCLLSAPNADDKKVLRPGTITAITANTVLGCGLQALSIMLILVGFYPHTTKVYNDVCLADNIANDFNFAPNPLKGDLKGSPEGLLEEAAYVKSIREDFFDTIDQDCIVAAADIVYADLTLGTRFSGADYDSGKYADVIINETKDYYLSHFWDRKKCFMSFRNFLESCPVTIDYESKLVRDQAYAFPYGGGAIPDVIICGVDQFDETGFVYDDGPWLTFHVPDEDGGEIELSYRIPCGYQPVNFCDLEPQTSNASEPSLDNPLIGWAGQQATD